MSYNVRVKFIVDAANPPWMNANDVVRLHDELADLPESNFVQVVHADAKKLVSAKSPCGKCKSLNGLDSKHCKECGEKLTPPNTSLRVELKKLWWGGNHATKSLPQVAPFIHGRMEAFFVGEDGEIFGGALFEDGKYTPMDVEMKLVPRKPGRR